MNAEKLAREYVALWNETGDPSAVRAFVHEDIVWFEPPESPIGDVFRGRRAVEDLLREWTENMGPTRAAIEELVVADDEVMMRVRLDLHGTSSELDLEAPIHFVLRVREGRFDRVRVFADRDEALAAVGLGADSQPP